MFREFFQMLVIRLYYFNLIGWLIAAVLILVGLTVALPAALIKRRKIRKLNKQ